MNLQKINNKEGLLALGPDDRFLIQVRRGGQYFRTVGAGSSLNIAEAGQYTPFSEFFYMEHFRGMEEVWSRLSPSHDFFVIVPDVPIDPTKPVPIERIFNASQIALMKQAPRADAVKGFVLQKVHKLPPAEVTTYEQLKDWVEASYKGRAAVSPNPGSAANPAASIRLEFEWSGRSYGTCEYTRRCNGETEDNLDVRTLADLAEGADSFPDLLDKLIEDQRDEHSDYEVMEDTGENEYSSFERGDESPSDVVVSLSTRTDQLKEFIRQHLPEQAERLGLNE
jgi:hypothetical protein